MLSDKLQHASGSSVIRWLGLVTYAGKCLSYHGASAGERRILVLCLSLLVLLLNKHVTLDRAGECSMCRRFHMVLSSGQPGMTGAVDDLQTEGVRIFTLV